MEGIPLLRVTFTYGNTSDASAVPIFPPYVLGRAAHTYRTNRGNLPQSVENVERGEERVYARRDSEFDVRRRSKIHGPNRVHKHDLVGTLANSPSLIFSLEHTGAGCVRWFGSYDHSDPREWIDRQQSEDVTNQTDEEQGREGKVNERST